MSDSSFSDGDDWSAGGEHQDALAIARMPELLKKMEQTAYALVRRGDRTTSNMLFMAVAAAEKSAIATNDLSPTCFRSEIQ